MLIHRYLSILGTLSVNRAQCLTYIYPSLGTLLLDLLTDIYDLKPTVLFLGEDLMVC